MAAASYTTDLADWIADGDTTAWTELTNATSGGAPDEADTESALQGTNSCSQITNTTALCSLIRILGTPVTLASGEVFLTWHGHGVATALQNYANGGLRIAVSGNAVGNWKAWAVGGVDVAPFPYAKWVNTPIDPTVAADYTNGTPPTGGTNIYGVGSMCILTQVVARGQPHICDIIRYGRAEARMNGGDLANGYATFAGFAAVNDTTDNRWGLIQATTGGYQWKGLMVLGFTSAVDFRDSNVNIFIQDCRKVSSTFNKIEIRQAGSRVDWTNISFLNAAPSTNASKGDLQVVDNADVNIDGCTFTDMGTFSFLSNSTITGSTFRRCQLITQGSAIFNGGSLITNATGAVAMLANNIDNVSATNFVSDGTGHAIELTAAHAGNSYTLTDVNFTGYASTDGSTGNEAIYNNSGGAVTINISGGNTPSIRNGAGASTTVVAGAVTVTLTVTTATGTAIQDANSLVYATAGGPFPAAASVTITNSGTTATVTHTSHGLSSNDKVLIKGASHPANRGVFSITVTGANTYTYTMASAPGSNPTGTITSTFVLLSGLTNAQGQLTMSRVFPSDQPIAGWSRKSSAAPYYKTGPVSGTVDSGTGATLTALLIADE